MDKASDCSMAMTKSSEWYPRPLQDSHVFADPFLPLHTKQGTRRISKSSLSFLAIASLSLKISY